MAFTDNFNRANGALGANWAAASGFNEWTIVSNAASCVGDGIDRVEIYTAGTFADDQYSQGVMGAITGGDGGSGVGLCVRGSVSVQSLYWVTVNDDVSNNIRVCKFVSTAFTEIAQRTQAFSAGDTLRLEVTGSGAATVLKVFRNGSQVGADVADSSGSHVTSGIPGLAYSSTTGVAETVDDWEGGDITGTPPVTNEAALRSAHTPVTWRT